jgi:hypothetical protein
VRIPGQVEGIRRAFPSYVHHIHLTANLVEAYRPMIELSRMNSGCTRPWKHPRGKDTFLPIETYPYRDRLKGRAKDDAVVELTVLGGVRDIKKFTLQVTRMQRSEVLETLYSSESATK